MLDLLQLHQPKYNRDSRAWILVSGKNLRKQIDLLQSKLLQTMSKDELLSLLAEKADVNLKVKLGNLSVRQWLTQIKELRRKRDLGRHKMEKLTGTSGRDWSRIEKGEHIPSCKKLKKIIEAVDFKVESVCDRNDFCLRSIDIIIKSFNSEWVPLVVISGLLELFKNRFNITEDQFKTFKGQMLKSIEQLRVLQDNSKPIKAAKEINENLAKILGAFAADGNFYPPDMIRWEDEYKEQLEVLSSWFESSFGITLKIKPSKRERNSFIAQFRNKVVSRYLGVFFDFHPVDKRYTVNEPRLIKEQSLEIRKAFAAGALMFDGSVNLDGTVSFSSVSKNFRDSVAEILLADNIKLSISQKSHNGIWNFTSSRELNSDKLRKLSNYFDENTLKRNILEFYLGNFNINNINDLRILFPKIKSKISLADLAHISKQLNQFDIYDLIKITNLPRCTLHNYLRILEVASIISSSRKGRRKVYIFNKLPTNFSGEYTSRSPDF